MLKTKLLIPLTTVIGISAIAPMSTLTSCGMQNTIAIQLNCDNGTLKTPVLMIQTGQTYGDVKNNLDALVQPKHNYVFSHWETMSGDEITDDYVFDKGEAINAKCIQAPYEIVTEVQWQSAMDKLNTDDKGYFPCLKMTSSDDHVIIKSGDNTLAFTQLAANYENATYTLEGGQKGQTITRQSHLISDGVVMTYNPILDEQSALFEHGSNHDDELFGYIDVFAGFCYNLFPYFTCDKDNIYHFNADLEEVLHVSADFGFASKNLTYVRIDGWLNIDEDPEPDVLLDVVAHFDYSYSKISLPEKFSEAIQKQNFNCEWEYYTFDVKGGSYTKDDSFSIHFTNIPEGSTKLTVYDGNEPATPDSWDWNWLYVGKNGFAPMWPKQGETFKHTSNSITFNEPIKSTDSITIAFKPNAVLSKQYTFKWSKE